MEGAGLGFALWSLCERCSSLKSRFIHLGGIYRAIMGVPEGSGIFRDPLASAWARPACIHRLLAFVLGFSGSDLLLVTGLLIQLLRMT